MFRLDGGVVPLRRRRDSRNHSRTRVHIHHGLRAGDDGAEHGDLSSVQAFQGGVDIMEGAHVVHDRKIAPSRFWPTIKALATG